LRASFKLVRMVKVKGWLVGRDLVLYPTSRMIEQLIEVIVWKRLKIAL
jgi:hypothetical protein